jgi:hypothetical protein
MVRRKTVKKWEINWFRVFLAALGLVIFAGMIYQIFTALRSPIKTTPAIPGTEYESLELDALALRQEQTLPLPSSGYTILASDGARLAKGEAWAASFPKQGQAADYARLKELRVLRERLAALSGSTLTGLSAQKLETEISELFLDFIDSSADGSLADEPEALAALSEKWGVLSALSAGESDYVEKKLSALDSEIKALEKSTASGKTAESPSAGVYISYSDGLENGGDAWKEIIKSSGKASSAVLTENLNSLHPQDIDALLAGQAKENTDGKIVTAFVWYFVANAPAAEVTRLYVGEKYTAVPGQTGERITIVLENIGSVEDGRVPLVFSCTAQDAALFRLRGTKLTLILNEQSGLRVPRSAIHVQDGETGVFILERKQVKFRRTLIRCTNEDYVIVRALSSDELESLKTDNPSSIALREQQLAEAAAQAGKERPSSLQRYDNIIIEGRGLVDGDFKP